MTRIHNGTIESAMHGGFNKFRAAAGNEVEFFYTMSAAAWWLEMLDTIKQSRANRNAR